MRFCIPSIVLVVLLISSLSSWGSTETENNPASESDLLLGEWIPEDGDFRVQINKTTKGYEGRIVWLKEPQYPEGHELAGHAKRDRHNPDVSMRNRPLDGLTILEGFQYVGKHEWKEGTIYDPSSGQTYRANIRMVDRKSIRLRGFIGVSLIGRTLRAQRYEDKREHRAAVERTAHSRNDTEVIPDNTAPKEKEQVRQTAPMDESESIRS